MRRRVSRAAITCALLVASFAGDATASAGPRFELDVCAWDATHILVATEGHALDGHLTVVDSWVGSRAPGTELHLPDLAQLAPVGRRTLKYRRGLVVTGARMVLFLREDPATGKWLEAEPRRGDIQSSACWIENDQVYANVASTNVGGNFLAPVKRSEQELRAHVLEIREAKRVLADLRTNEDAGQRLAVAARYVDADNAFAVHEAFKVIQGCGKVAVPFLVSLMALDRDGRYEERVFRALGEIGDPSAVPPLLGLLEEELVFWTEAKERLEDGWWSGDAMKWDERRILYLHIDRVEEPLRALKEMAAPGFEDVVRRTRRLWITAPALDGAWNGRIVRACDAALRAVATQDARK